MRTRIQESISHRITNRRKFVAFCSDSTIEFEDLKTYNFSSDYEDLSLLINIPSQFRRRLSKVRKSGGWRSIRIANWKRNVWHVGSFRYWKGLKYSIHKIGGHSQTIKSLTLRKYRYVNYHAQQSQSNSLNMYTFKITKSSSGKFDIDEAFSLELAGSYAFQHFIDHAMAYTYLASEFLSKKPQIPVLVSEPNHTFKNREFLFKRLGITNHLINVTKTEVFSIKNFYVLKANPHEYLYSVPYELVASASNKLSSWKANGRLIVLLIREEKNRNFANLDVLLATLSDFSIKYGLTFRAVYPSRISTIDLAKVLEDCFILIGVHGGALCNLVFLPKGSYVLEFVPLKDGASLMHLAIGCGVGYLPIPSSFGTSTRQLEVDLVDLMIALDFIIGKSSSKYL